MSVKGSCPKSTDINPLQSVTVFRIFEFLQFPQKKGRLLFWQVRGAEKALRGLRLHILGQLVT